MHRLLSRPSGIGTRKARERPTRAKIGARGPQTSARTSYGGASRDMAASGEPQRVGRGADRLPAPLQSVMEAMSGFSLADVVVHRNSAEPARLGAVAFTKGDHIHLASGQERHLPHEAWHVVQQKQGRVKPTLQMKGGTAINDDAGLEREADRMGEAALGSRPVGERPLREAPSAGARQVAQRRVALDHNKLMGDESKQVIAVADALDLAVDTARRTIMSDPAMTSKNNVSLAKNAHIGNWAASFDFMTQKGSLPEFFYARFGYAIETIATGIMRSKSFKPLTVYDQVTAGATRPDFVVRNAKEAEVAWLDVTSSGSIGHIGKKNHSGWGTRPYVAEILYDPPLIPEFSKATELSEKDKQALASMNKAAAEAELDFQAGHDALAPVLEGALQDQYDARGPMADTTIRQVVKSALDKVFADVNVRITVNEAGEVLRNIQTIKVRNSDGVDLQDKGANWAGAFEKKGRVEGRKLIRLYGGKIRNKAPQLLDMKDEKEGHQQMGLLAPSDKKGSTIDGAKIAYILLAIMIAALISYALKSKS
ncbi:MAG: hypothetical protein JWO25_2933 [Alphaproteobacteria bacterium]|nr:hypothetical protein [Alphaproteobacteria bacterium]